MIITKEFLKQHNACEDGYKYWVKCNLPDLGKFMLKCAEDQNYFWAYWLFTRAMGKEASVKVAIFSAELVLPIFENRFPEDKRPRHAIEAAKNWLVLQNEEASNEARAARDAAAYDYTAAAYAAAAADYAAAAARSAARSAGDAYDYTASCYSAVRSAVDASVYAFASYNDTQNEIINYAVSLIEGR